MQSFHAWRTISTVFWNWFHSGFLCRMCNCALGFYLLQPIRFFLCFPDNSVESWGNEHPTWVPLGGVFSRLAALVLVRVALHVCGSEEKHTHTCQQASAPDRIFHWSSTSPDELVIVLLEALMASYSNRKQVIVRLQAINDLGPFWSRAWMTKVKHIFTNAIP